MESSRNDFYSHFLHVTGRLTPSLQNLKSQWTHARILSDDRDRAKRNRVREGRRREWAGEKEGRRYR